MPSGVGSRSLVPSAAEVRVRALMGALREYRSSLGVSQNALSVRSGVDRNVISKMELAADSPDGPLPHMRSFAGLAHALGLDVTVVLPTDRAVSPLLMRQAPTYLSLLSNSELRTEADDIWARLSRQLGSLAAGIDPEEDPDDRLVARRDLIAAELARRGLDTPGTVEPAEGDDLHAGTGTSAVAAESPFSSPADYQLRGVYWPHPPRFAGDELPELYTVVRVAGGRAYRAGDGRWYSAEDGPSSGRLIVWPVVYWAPILDGENPGYILPDPDRRGPDLQTTEN